MKKPNHVINIGFTKIEQRKEKIGPKALQDLNYYNDLDSFAWAITTSLKYHCVKSVLIRSYFGPHFPAFGLNTERYSVSLRIQSECGKMQTRITPNTDTFHAVYIAHYCSYEYYNHAENRKHFFVKSSIIDI